MVLDALAHPRGPEPPAVYWRRRAVLLTAVLVLGALLVRSCGGDGEPTGLTVRSPSPGPSVTPGPSGPRPTPTPTAARTPTASPTPTRSPGGPCRTADLRVTATADARTYPAGLRPRFTLTVTNVGGVACTRDVGSAATELRVLSGTDRIWSSDDCTNAGSSDVTLLEPGESETTSLTWARRRSAPGCPADRDAAAPGTYRLYGRLGDITVAGDVFSLR